MNKNEFKSEKEQALNIIANALAEYRGNWHEHQIIQKALQFIIALIEEHEKNQNDIERIQNFDKS